MKKQCEELKVEKQAREEERLKLEQKAETSQKERLRLQEEIAAKKEEAKAKLANVQESEKARQSMQTNLEDLVKEIGARNADEEKYAEEIKFLQKLNDAVSLRFIEPKNS